MKGRFGLVGSMDKRKKGGLVGNQMVSVTLAPPYNPDSDGKIHLTCSLSSDTEIDHEIDNVIKELELVRKKAKQKINFDNDKIHSELQIKET